MSERQIHVEVTAIRGWLPGNSFARASLGVDFDIDHVDHGAHIWGYNQSQAGLFRTLASVLRMNLEYEEEVVVKIRASWEELRKVFTGYVTGWRSYGRESTPGTRLPY